MPFPRHPKSFECKAIEEFMRNEDETELILLYSCKKERISRHATVNNVITRNGFPLIMQGIADRIIVRKTEKEVK